MMRKVVQKDHTYSIFLHIWIATETLALWNHQISFQIRMHGGQCKEFLVTTDFKDLNPGLFCLGLLWNEPFRIPTHRKSTDQIYFLFL